MYKSWKNIPKDYLPEEFKLKVRKETQDLLDNLKKLMNSPFVDYIICATDADREGENIFNLIYTYVGCKKSVKRLWLDSFTPDRIKKAFDNLKDWDYYLPLRQAGYGRMISDWILGALLTAHATVKLGRGDIITVGRVQTAVLNEIVKRELEIRNFKRKKFYVITGTFQTQQGKKYEGELVNHKFDTKEEAQNFIDKIKNKKDAVVIEYKEKTEKELCPLLYDQTSLQVDSSKYLNFSPDKTLALSQSLYEKGFLTYPRTASRFLTASDYNDVIKIIDNLTVLYPIATKYKVDKNNKRIFDDSKVESHTAIIPTTKKPNLNTMSSDEKQLYDLVCKRLIAINFPPAIYTLQSAKTQLDTNLIFTSSGKIENSKGWKEVYNFNEKFDALPSLSKNEKVTLLSLNIKTKQINPPPRYTEASILQFMETCGKQIEDEKKRELMKDKGIGTSATRAEIIKRLKDIGYIKIKKKTIYPTEKGMKFIEIFPVDELKSAEFTGEMEYKLAQVEKGKLSLNSYLDFIKQIFKQSVDKIYNIQQTLEYSQQQYLPVSKFRKRAKSDTKTKKQQKSKKQIKK